MSKSPRCPLCHKETEKLYLVSLEGLSVLLCGQCLHEPTVMKNLSILEEDSTDDSQYEDEED